MTNRDYIMTQCYNYKRKILPMNHLNTNYWQDVKVIRVQRTCERNRDWSFRIHFRVTSLYIRYSE